MFGCNWLRISSFSTRTTHPLIKLKRCLEGRIKRFLLLYKRLIQPYLSLLWLLLATHFVTRVTPINDIDGKSHKTVLKSSHNYSTNYLIIAYGVDTHTYFGGMKLISRNQARGPTLAWLKKHPGVKKARPSRKHQLAFIHTLN